MPPWFAKPAVAAAAAMLLLVPGVAAAESAMDEQADLDATEDRLVEAERTLHEVEAQLDRAAEAVDRADARLATASAELQDVRARLEGAEARLEEATRADQVAARSLLAATRALDDRESARRSVQATLDARAVAVYKRGPAVGGALLLQGVAGARDLHEVAVAVHTVEGMMDQDLELIDRSEQLTDRALQAQDVVHARRAASKTRQREASVARRQVEQLVRQQEALVAGIEQERATKAAVLASVENDRTATAVLVRQLRERVAELRFDAAEALLAANVDASFVGPVPDWASALPAKGRRWAPAIAGAAARAGIDARLLAAVVWTESAFTPTAVSHAGALGLAQLMPGTAAGLGVDPFDPIANLTGGARYLRIQLERFGRVDLALAAYNAGPNRVATAGNRIPDIVETQLYVVRVLDRYDTLR